MADGAGVAAGDDRAATGLPAAASPGDTDASSGPGLMGDAAGGGPLDEGIACLGGDGAMVRQVIVDGAELDPEMIEALAAVPFASPGLTGAEAALVALNGTETLGAGRQQRHAGLSSERGDATLRRIFSDTLLPCATVRAVRALLADWRSVPRRLVPSVPRPAPGDQAAGADDAADASPPDGEGAGETEAPLPPDVAALARRDAWARVRSILATVPAPLRHRVSRRIAEGFLLEGRLAPLVLLEPLMGEIRTSAASRLIAAHVALALGREEEGRVLLTALAGEDNDAGQIAAVLMAERLDPREDAPLEIGWLGHIELLAAIATEHGGTAFGARAAPTAPP
ncbi:MAG: hypothetical protein AAFR52_15370 [Pseudomonadota bacterium]